LPAPLAETFAFEVKCFGEAGMKNVYAEADESNRGE